MKKEFDLLVFIGRFQPLHNEHRRIIDIALEKSRHVLILIGSAGKPRNIRNPFTYQERRMIIQKNFPAPRYGEGLDGAEYSLPEHECPRLIIRPLFDKTYNDSAWIKQVQDNVTSVAMDIANTGLSNKIFRPNGIADLKIGLIGAAKDHTSYYLKMFPQYENVDVPLTNDLHSTVIREAFLEGSLTREVAEKVVPPSVIRFLYEDFSGVRSQHDTTEAGFLDTTYYDQLARELQFVRNYKKSWLAAPYPVKHATVDAIVEQSGHVLVVQRKAEPGKGLWALPGGHLNEFERQLDGAIRELREETKIKVPEAVLRGSIVNQRTFDDPYRSNLGRVITQAFHIKLTDMTELPKVKGADDAIVAKWLPIGDIREDMFFDDHFHIIQFFLGLS